MEKLMFHQLVDNDYIGIVTILDYEIRLRKCLLELPFPPSNSKRKIIVDLALKSGVNKYRFIVLTINNEGTVLWDSNAYVEVDEFVKNSANKFLQEKKEIVMNSILPSSKIQEILSS